MLSPQYVSRYTADEGVGDYEEKDQTHAFGVDGDGVAGVLPQAVYGEGDAGSSARIEPEDQAVADQVDRHEDYCAADDE